MDFFHCNICYDQPGPPDNKQFWLTNCGHSFCNECVKTNEPKCRVCCNECKYLSLNNDVPEDLKIFFSDAVKELRKTIKILLVQNKHCKLFMEEYVPKLESKYVTAKMAIESKKNEIGSVKNDLEKKEAEIQALKHHVSKLESELQNFKKKYYSVRHHVTPSPSFPSPPSSYGSIQEEMFTPKSGLSGNNYSSSRGNF